MLAKEQRGCDSGRGVSNIVQVVKDIYGQLGKIVSLERGAAEGTARVYMDGRGKRNIIKEGVVDVMYEDSCT
jgi:hypothetical protein